MINQIALNKDDILFLKEEQNITGTEEQQSKKKRTIIGAFGRNSPLGQFVATFYDKVFSSDNPNVTAAFFKRIETILTLQEKIFDRASPTFNSQVKENKQELNRQIAILGFTAAGIWDNHWKTVDLKKVSAEFLECIVSCHIETLKKYHDLFIQRAFKENYCNIANRFKLFIKRKIRTQEEEQLFEESLNFIINSRHQLTDIDELNFHAARLSLLAAGLWGTNVPRKNITFKDCVTQDTKEFCAFVAKLDEQTLKALWADDLLAGMLDPVETNILSYTMTVHKDAQGNTRYFKEGAAGLPKNIFPIDVDLNTMLGKGGNGTVYKGYALNEKGERIPAKPYATKYIDITTDITLEEAEHEASITRREAGLSRTLAPIKNGTQIILPMELVSGDTTRSLVAYNRFKDLPLVERTGLLHDISIAMTALHHRGVIHLDVKFENFSIKDRTNEHGEKVSDVTFLDYGNSLRIEDIYNLEEGIHWSTPAGTPQYIAPEVLDNQCFLESDIYSLTPIFLSILGAKNPLEKKYQCFQEGMAGLDPRTTGYEFRGLFEGLKFPLAVDPKSPQDAPADYNYIKRHISVFMLRMQQQHPKQRPSDEGLFAFTKNLKEFTQILTINANPNLPNEQKIGIDILNIKALKIMLLAWGIWEETVENNIRKVDFELEDYLEDYPDLCEEIYVILANEHNQFIDYHNNHQATDPNYKNYTGLNIAKQKIKDKIDTIKTGIIQQTKQILQHYGLFNFHFNATTKFADFDFENNIKFCERINAKYKNYDPSKIVDLQLDFYIQSKENLLALEGNQKSAENALTTQEKIYMAYKYKAILEGLPKENLAISEYVSLVISRMDKPDDEKRIVKEEADVFVQALKRTTDILKSQNSHTAGILNNNLKNELKIEAAKIILVGRGFWKENVLNSRGKIDFKFENYPNLCATIHTISNQNVSEDSIRKQINDACLTVKHNIINQTKKILKTYGLYDFYLYDKTKFSDFDFANNLEFCETINAAYAQHNPLKTTALHLDFYIKAKENLLETEGNKKKFSHFFSGYETKDKLSAAKFIKSLMTLNDPQQKAEQFYNPWNKKLLKPAMQGTLGMIAQSVLTELHKDSEQVVENIMHTYKGKTN